MFFEICNFLSVDLWSLESKKDNISTQFSCFSSAVHQKCPVSRFQRFKRRRPLFQISDLFNSLKLFSPVCSAGDSVLEAQVELQKLAELVPGPVQPGTGQQLSLLRARAAQL